MHKLKILCLLLPCLLAACALGDVPNSMPIPPVTLVPPATLTFEGNCEANAELDHWLQSSSFLAADFLTEINTAAALDRGEMYEPVLRLASLRDQLNRAPAPDCAHVVHELLSVAMSAGVDAFQAYVNGDTSELGTTIADVSNQIETVMAMQQELIARLEEQYRQEQTQP
jgi:hypothetical protein